MESAPRRSINNAYLPIFTVGDRVRYVGRGENGIFTLNGIRSDVLTVVRIEGYLAEVSSPKWVTTQNVPLKDLQKVR